MKHIRVEITVDTNKKLDEDSVRNALAQGRFFGGSNFTVERIPEQSAEAERGEKVA